MQKKSTELTSPGQNTTISSPSDADLFVSCDKVEGALTVSESFDGVLNLTEISRIEGDLTVTNVGGITKINLPALEKVEGTVTVTDNGGLKNLTLSGLQSVSGKLTVQGNNGLSYVNLQDLEDVEGGLALVGGFRFAFLSVYNECMANGAVYPSPTSTRSTATPQSKAPTCPAACSTASLQTVYSPAPTPAQRQAQG